MPRKIGDALPPKGFKRLLFRAPIWLYYVGLGQLLGGRFLLLNHTGRKSGQPRQTVLEVVDFDLDTGTYFIASGFGKKSDRYLNILKKPEVEIQVGSKRIQATSLSLTPVKSVKAMVGYARRNPRAAKQLMPLCGYEVEGRDRDYFIRPVNSKEYAGYCPETAQSILTE